MDVRNHMDSKLTPAAKQALEELVQDYRDQLLVGAAESAERFGELREISVHDIMAGMGRQQSRRSGPTRSSLERLLRLYVYAGVLAGGIGMAVYFVMQMPAEQQFEQQLPLLIAVSGLLLAVVSYLMLWTRRSRLDYLVRRHGPSDFETAEYGAYLALWRDLEVAIRRAAAVRLGESEAAGSISTLLDQLERTDILTSQDRNLLRRLLVLRNAIAHGRAGDLARGSERTSLHEGARLLERLRNVS